MKTTVLTGFSLIVLFGGTLQAEASDKPKIEASTTDKTSSFFDVSGLGSQVVSFTTEQVAQELAKKQTVVYFFSATWCGECQETYRDIQAHWRTIPKDFTLIYVNFDKERQLRQKYGVTIQHTFVVVGPNGERKKIWVGTVPIADIVEIATHG
jgi:thioredoxin-like negative regulator of GroEL